MAETLEQKVNAPQEAEKKEKKPPTLWESALKEYSDFGGAVLDSLVSAAGLTAAGAFGYYTAGLVGAIGTGALALSYLYSDRLRAKLRGEEFTSDKVRNSALKATAGSVAISSGVLVAQNLAQSGLAGLVSGYTIPAYVLAPALTLLAMPFINLVYHPIKYLIDNKKFEGMWKGFGMETLNYTLKFGIPAAAIVGVATAAPALTPLLLPAIALYNTFYRTFLTKDEKREYKRLLYPSTYLPDSLNPFVYISSGISYSVKTIKRWITGLHDLGSAISNALPGPATAPAPAK